MKRNYKVLLGEHGWYYIWTDADGLHRSREYVKRMDALKAMHEDIVKEASGD